MSLVFGNSIELMHLLSKVIHQYRLEGVDVLLKKKLAQISKIVTTAQKCRNIKEHLHSYKNNSCILNRHKVSNPPQPKGYFVCSLHLFYSNILAGGNRLVSYVGNSKALALKYHANSSQPFQTTGPLLSS